MSPERFLSNFLFASTLSFFSFGILYVFFFWRFLCCFSHQFLFVGMDPSLVVGAAEKRWTRRDRGVRESFWTCFETLSQDRLPSRSGKEKRRLSLGQLPLSKSSGKGKGEQCRVNGVCSSFPQRIGRYHSPTQPRRLQCRLQTNTARRDGLPRQQHRHRSAKRSATRPSRRHPLQRPAGKGSLRCEFICRK